MAGTSIQTLSSVVTGLATNFIFISIGRFLCEFKPTHSSQVLINHWFIKQRGKALGIAATGFPLGTLILSPVSQFLINMWAWRVTLFFWAVITAIMLIPLFFFVHNKPEEIGLIADGEFVDSENSRSSHHVQVDATLTSQYQNRSVIDVIKSGSFWLLSGSHLICGIGCGLMMTHTVIFATDMGYPAMIGASFLSVQGGVSLVGILLTGPLSDRISRNKVLSLSHFIRSMSFVTLVVAIFFAKGSLGILFFAMALFGFGWFTTAPLMAGLAADLFGYLKMGTIIGIVMSFHMLGMAIGTYSGGITYQLAGSYAMIFIIQGILEFAAAVFAFMIKRR